MSFPLVAGLSLAVLSLALAWALLRLVRVADRREEDRQQAVEDRQRAVDFMHLMAETLGEGLAREELNQRIVHASILCSGALSACLFEFRGGLTLRGVAVEGLFPPHRPLAEPAGDAGVTRARFIEQVLKSEEIALGEGVVGRVAATREGELIADAAADARMVRHRDPALAVRSVIAVPVAFRERLFGVLVVTNPVEDRAFTELEFSLMESLAEQAALALNNAEFLNLQIEKKQLDLDLSIASGIQQMLLPKQSVAVAGLDVDSRYRPAQKVGGDLYDIIVLSPTRVGVVVADVSGKGIPASLLMAICRTNLRQIAPRHTSPAAALAELNRAMEADASGGLYVTMLYAVIDVLGNRATFARAGHELPLFSRRDLVSGVYLAQYVRSEGMPLGMVSDELFTAVIEDRSEPFGPGDTLVLYTDGVTEAPNEEEKEFSGARLADVVRALHQRPAAEINDAVLTSVLRFTGDGAQRDDFTLVTVKRG
jgi:sigma-B regulation protein RsbU (phosphoserine phosphatase)